MASKEILKQKEAVVSEITNKLDASKTFLLLNYQGLTVSEFAELRRQLRDATKDNKGSLGKVNDGDYNDAVIDAAKELEVGKYTTSPVKSSYGYHIIYKEAQDEKKELTDEVKTTITETIAKQIANEDTFYARALIALREKNNMKFVDGDLEKIYNDVVNK